MRKKLISLYYLLLGLISIGLVIYTVFVGSRNIHYGYQVKKLTLKRNNLQQIHQTLSQESNKEITIAQIEKFADEAGFEPIKKFDVIIPE